ncbi:MAG TPA: hypothetical protein VFM77_02015 [Terriglobales bacterium]|nr:hypothetical protein [Terriglobales bacterium]
MKRPRNGPATVGSQVFDLLRTASVPARKLFAVIVREAYHGPIHPKVKGTATPPEILEACGLDVGEFYLLLEELKRAGLIQVSNPYPFEEITLSAASSEAETLAERCLNAKIPLEEVFVNLIFSFDQQG